MAVVGSAVQACCLHDQARVPTSPCRPSPPPTQLTQSPTTAPYPPPTSPPTCTLQGLDSSWSRAGGGPSPQLLRLLTSTADYTLVLLRTLELMAGARAAAPGHDAVPLLPAGWLAWIMPGTAMGWIALHVSPHHPQPGTLQVAEHSMLSPHPPLAAQARCHSCSWRAAT